MENIFDVTFENGPVSCVYWWSLWDEWKWKVSSALEQTKWIDYVAVPTWWANAWHNVVFNWKKIALHELPGWAIIQDAKVYIWQWRVVNISWLSKEIEDLKNIWCNKKNQLIVAWNTQIIFDLLQKKLDSYIEEIRASKVWTTKKWIWPAYALKALRTWISVNELINDPKSVEEKTMINYELFNKIFEWVNIKELFKDISNERQLLQNLIERWEVSIDENNMLLNQEVSKWKKILIEASQSALLALDGWMYPNCTSSDTSINWALSALNLIEVNNWIAVMKAVKSKVWSWNFPTKFEEEIAKPYRIVADEFWATTWRPRDVWYFDAVESRYVLSKNKTSVLFITKADLLKDLPEVKIWLSYRSKSWKIYSDYIPTLQSEYDWLQVEYSRWFILKEDIWWMTDISQLPQSYKDYFDFLIEIVWFEWRVVIWTWAKPNEFIIYK